jgi:hypothetical protein
MVIGWTTAAMALTAPTNYPTVPLAAGSDPRFASVSIDAWSNHIAYLLFDGNLKDGYNRMYVWSPTYPRFTRPVALTTTEGTKYSPVIINQTNSDEAVTIHWQFNWGRRSSHDYFDYLTGKLITVPKSEVVTYPVFAFAVQYSRGPRALPGRTPTPPPLDVQVPAAELYVAPTMTNMYPTVIPWYQLNFYMGNRSRGQEQDYRRASVNVAPS